MNNQQTILKTGDVVVVLNGYVYIVFGLADTNECKKKDRYTGYRLHGWASFGFNPEWEEFKITEVYRAKDPYAMHKVLETLKSPNITDLLEDTNLFNQLYSEKPRLTKKEIEQKLGYEFDLID